MVFRVMRRTCLGLGRVRRQGNLISGENAHDAGDPQDTMSQALGQRGTSSARRNQEQRDQPGKGG